MENMEVAKYSLWMRLLSVTILAPLVTGTLYDRENQGISDLSLESILPGTTEVNYQRNSISHIPTGVLPSTLIRIDFGDNTVTSIADYAFSACYDVTWLKFQGCNLPTITRYMFAGLIKLDNLLLKYCGIQTIEPYSFADLGLLTTLEFIGNNLQKIRHNPAGFFQGLTNLGKIVVSENGVDAVDDYALSLLPNVTYIDLSECELPKVTADMFAAVYNLETLDMYECDITAIEDYSFRDLGKLTLLKLVDTDLKSLSSAVFDAGNLPTALTLDIGNEPGMECDDRMCWIIEVCKPWSVTTQQFKTPNHIKTFHTWYTYQLLMKITRSSPGVMQRTVYPKTDSSSPYLNHHFHN